MTANETAAYTIGFRAAIMGADLDRELDLAVEAGEIRDTAGADRAGREGFDKARAA